MSQLKLLVIGFAAASSMAFAQASLSLTSTYLNFGAVAVGSGGSLYVDLVNNGSSSADNLNFSGLTPPSAPFQILAVCPSSLPAGQSCTITISFTPTTTGTTNASWTVTSSDAGSVTANLIGVGIATSSLSFGNQRILIPSTPQILTISNTGSQAINTGTGITVTGTNAEDFMILNECGASLAVGSNCPVAVWFTPMMVGSASATLNVLNADGSTFETIPLSGTGTISGYFEIFNAKTGRVLEVPGASLSNGTLVQQNSLNGTPQQQWELIPTSNAAYEIMNVATGKVLDVIGGSKSDGTQIQQYTYLGGANQQWMLNSVDDVHYAIQNMNSLKVLDVPFGTSAVNTPIQQWDDLASTGDIQQMWVLVPINSYNIVNAKSSDALDVVGASSSNGAQIEQATQTGSRNQQWQFIPTGGGNFAIVNRNSGGALDDTGASTSNGNLMQLYQPLGGDTDQEWQLVPLDTNGHFQVKNLKSQLVLDDTGGSTTSGTLIQQWQAISGDLDQEWTISPVVYYNITNGKSSLVLDVPGGSTTSGANIQQWVSNGLQQQQWMLVPVSGTSNYALVNNLTGLALDDPSGSKSNGTLVTEATFTGATEQQWTLNLSGTTTIANAAGGLVLDVIDGSMNPGTLIQVYTNIGVNNQQWTLVAAAGQQ